ncbi:MAG TPA: 16S rRNA (guanine(527)-N(7))-methyltransferase RsmG [Hyphomicrobiaceae bacterium]|nr:16S rRNA (guanine(527)-N(7))-methyltransferase RsmG [Hyphomicrobiaceae bacterium]
MQPIHGPDDFAAAFGAPAATIDRLTLYERLLRQWQKAVNLVAPSTLEHVWHRHFADSAQIVSLSPPDVRSWIDLGSGGGFPGLVAAIMMAGGAPSARPSSIPPQTPIRRGEGSAEGQEQSPTSPGQDAERRHAEAGASVAVPHSDPLPASGERGLTPIHFTLIESDVRKSAFLREVVRQTGLMQTGITVDILSKRAESARVSVNESLPRVVSARALAPLDRLLELAAPYSLPGTTLLFLKGKEADREVQLAESRWKFQVALVPSVTDRHGRIAVITNLERKAKD